MAQAWSDYMQEFPQETGLGAVLARLARIRWPQNTAKHAARAWGLDATTAANVVRGSASERTLFKAIRADGWELLMKIGEAVIGCTYEEYLQKKLERLEHVRNQAADHSARVDRLRARVASLA